MAEKLFGDLYKYSGADGKMTVIPDLPTVRQKVAEGFQRIFTSDFVTDPETPNGVLIDAISILFFDVLGVTSQNANGMNINLSAGQLLDALGGIFGVQRLEGESDNSYRRRILDSQARGTGTAQSVRQALSNNVHVVNFSVLENIQHYPVALPKDSETAIAVDPHSIAVCVKMDDLENIDSALQNVLETKSIGCGCSEMPDIEEGHEHTLEGVTIYDAVDRNNVFVSCIARRRSEYSGSDFEKEIKDAIMSYISDHSMCSVVDGEELNQFIQKTVVGSHFSLLSVDRSYRGSQYDNNRAVIRPYEFVVFDETNIWFQDRGNW